MGCVQGDVHQALIVLQKGVAQCFPDNQLHTDPRSLHTKGKAMLLVGRFMEETANSESNAIMKAYKVYIFFTLFLVVNQTPKGLLSTHLAIVVFTLGLCLATVVNSEGHHHMNIIVG